MNKQILALLCLTALIIAPGCKRPEPKSNETKKTTRLKKLVENSSDFSTFSLLSVGKTSFKPGPFNVHFEVAFTVFPGYKAEVYHLL